MTFTTFEGFVLFSIGVCVGIAIFACLRCWEDKKGEKK